MFDELTIAQPHCISDNVLGIVQELAQPDSLKLSFSDDFVASDKNQMFE